MKYIICAICLIVGVALGYFIFTPNYAEQLDLAKRQKELLQQNEILLVENVKLKKRINKNLDQQHELLNSIDSIKKRQQYDLKKASDRIKHLSTATDAELLRIFSRYAGEN